MQIINIVVVVIFGINIILPFIIDSVNPISNGLGWSMGIMWFCIAQRYQRQQR